MTIHAIQVRLSVVLASARMRIINLTRYPGQMLSDLIVPIVVASLPILLGRATAGENASAIFAANTGTGNYVGYMLIGSSVYSIVSYAFWHIAYWLRWEMETGTLEALYLTPTNRFWVAAGTALYSMIRSVVTGLIAYILGSYILGSNPFQGELLLALLFILVGLLPVYGLTLLFGALVLKLKEASALINLMQWGVSFLMGLFFPITVFPPLLKAIAMAFPPTWMTNGARSALLGVGYFFQEWYFDVGVLTFFALLAPLLGYVVFNRVESNVRRHEGVGQF